MIRSSNESLDQSELPFSLSLRCPPEEGLDHQLPLKRTEKALNTHVPDEDYSLVTPEEEKALLKAIYYVVTRLLQNKASDLRAGRYNQSRST